MFKSNMKIIILLITFMHFIHLIKSECKPTGRQCLNEKQFIFCIVVGNESTYVGDVITCPGETVCNDVGYFACDDGLSTTTVTTIISTTDTETTNTFPPSTTDCPVFTTIPISSTDTPTPSPTKSDTTTPSATTSSPTSTPTTKQTTTTTTTTTNAPITPPSCYGSGKYQAPACNQYYECVRVLWWYEPVLKTCPTDQAFNVTTKACVPAEEVNCKL